MHRFYDKFFKLDPSKDADLIKAFQGQVMDLVEFKDEYLALSVQPGLADVMSSFVFTTAESAMKMKRLCQTYPNEYYLKFYVIEENLNTLDHEEFFDAHEVAFFHIQLCAINFANTFI